MHAAGEITDASMRPSDITDGIAALDALRDAALAAAASMRPSDITDGITLAAELEHAEQALLQ